MKVVEFVILSLTILFLVIVFFSLRLRSSKYKLFQLRVFFNLFAMAYFFIGLTTYAVLYSGWNNHQLILLCWLAIAAVISFNLSYNFFRNSDRIPTVNKQPVSHTVLSIAVWTSIFVEASVILAVGPINFFYIDRIDRFPILKTYEPILYLANMLNVALPFALNRYFRHKEKRDRKLIIIIIIHNLFFGIFTISRALLIYTAICLGYFFEREKILRRSTMIIIGLLSFVLFFVFKGILYDLILSKSYENFNPGEFINWIRNSLTLLEQNVTSKNLPNNSYLLAIESIFNPVPKGDALSEWFIKEFRTTDLVLGLTYGFSGLIEGYLYIGTFGVMLHFAFIGFIFSFIEKQKTEFWECVTIYVLYLMFRLFRSELYGFVKTFTWYYLYQAFFLYKCSSFLYRKKI